MIFHLKPHSQFPLGWYFVDDGYLYGPFDTVEAATEAKQDVITSTPANKELWK